METEEVPVKAENKMRYLPWVEKYRPKFMKDVAYQEEALMALKKSVDDRNLPHLLLYGPPGTGKTSTVLALAHELFGPDLSGHVLEMNASDERGISVIREKVILFAQQSVKQSTPGYPSPPYKIIIMDEADSLTMDAQSALRRVMESYSRVTRFYFICNYISKIIPAISSRCARFEFGNLPQNVVVDRLRYISLQEHMDVADEALSFLYEQSQGDLRSGIQLLQNAHTIYQGEHVTIESLQKIIFSIPDEVVFRLWNTIQSTVQASNLVKLTEVVESICLEGYPLGTLLLKLSDCSVEQKELSDEQKAEIAMIIADADKAANDGCDGELILLDTCCSIIKCIS